MYKVKAKIFLSCTIILFFCLCMINRSYAEKISLKSGKVVEGKIVEQNEKSVKVEIMDGVVVTYFQDEIEKIEKDSPKQEEKQPQLPPKGPGIPKGAGAPRNPNGGPLPPPPPGQPGMNKVIDEGAFNLGETEDSFKSERISVKVSGPQGWSKDSNSVSQSGQRILFLYKRSKEDKVPTIIVGEDILRPDENSMPDYLARVKHFMQKIPDSTFEEPQEVNISGKTAYKIIINTASKFRIERYIFLKEKIAVLLSYRNTVEDFDKDYSVFQGVLNSLVIE